MFDKNENHQTVPLSMMLKRELANEKVERPEILDGQASQSKKGEDFTLVKTECQRVVGDGVSTYSVFGSVKVFRCQLPRDNPFYSSEPPKKDSTDTPLKAGDCGYGSEEKTFSFPSSSMVCEDYVHGLEGREEQATSFYTDRDMILYFPPSLTASFTYDLFH